jgi:hypothetical protein
METLRMATKNTRTACNDDEDKRYVPEDSKKNITITITAEHIALARCGDAGACVVAQACLDHWGQVVEKVCVGTHVTKVYFAGTPGSKGRVVRFQTPSMIRRHIPVFDRTRQWGLPEGQYTLLKPTYEKLGPRPPGKDGGWDKVPAPHLRVKHGDGRRDVHGDRALPTRKTYKVVVTTV